MHHDVNDNVFSRIAIAAVIVAELVFLLWFFSFDLPNAAVPGSPDQHFSRLDIWQLALPGLATGSKFLAVQAFERLANISDLSQRAPILGYCLLIILAAFCIGCSVHRGLWTGSSLKAESDQRAQFAGTLGGMTAVEQLVMAYGLGLSTLSLLTLGLGLVGWLHRSAVAFIFAGAAIATGTVAWHARRQSNSPAGTSRHPGLPSLDRPQTNPLTKLAYIAGAVAIGLFLTISLLGAMLPATDFDVLEYHIQGPKEFYQTGQIRFAPHNVYMNMPFGTEMLTLLAMIVVGDWWWGALVGQTVLATFAPMTALGIWALARRLFSPGAGWLAALVYLTTPWIYRISIIPYTENALCFYLLCGVLAATLAMQSPVVSGVSRLWFLTGLLAGSAAACKYPAIVSTVIPLGLVALVGPFMRRPRATDSAAKERGRSYLPISLGTLTRSASEEPSLARRVSVNEQRSSSGPVPNSSADRQVRPASAFMLRRVLAFALGVAVTFGPWLAKNWALAGNPVYPLLYGVFGGREWTLERNSKWEWSHRVALLVALGLQRPPEGVTFWPGQSQHAITFPQLWSNLVDVTAMADWQSPLVFGLAPLALLVPRRRTAAVWLMLLVGYLFLQWWLLTHRLDRFWVPLLPIAAVLAGAGAEWSTAGAWRAFLAIVTVLVVFYNFSYSSTGLCGNNEYDATLRNRTAPMNPAVNWMNENLPPAARVIAVGAADLFHLDRPSIYNTVFDECIFESLVRDRSPVEVAQSLGGRGITHVYVSWSWVARYREPGNYGFTDFVAPQVFRELTESGVLRRISLERLFPVQAVTVADEQVPSVELYEVVVPESP